MNKTEIKNLETQLKKWLDDLIEEKITIEDKILEYKEMDEDIEYKIKDIEKFLDNAF